MIRGIIFDMDGVLLDSMPLWETAGEEYVLGQGKTPASDLRDVLFTKSMMEAAAYIRREYQLKKEDAQIAEEIILQVYDRYKAGIPLKSGVLHALDVIKGMGIPMVIATANDKKLAILGLKYHNIQEYFMDIITCREVGRGKEDALVYERARQRMGTERLATWVVEDSLHGIRTANRAGFPTVGVYDRASRRMQKEIRKEAAFYLDSLENIASLKAYWKGNNR